jgi:crotonobetainyl-CoA:carnitine CoA-transferase CaiB-like acyl-CoA transferase
LTGVKRPLAGLKVLDITRVIAAPSITRGLAEMGASVMRVTASHLVDFSSLHCDLNWGKWNTCLDLRKTEDREKMRKLILDADVVVEGYRPGVLDKWGLGKDNVLKICEGRNRGVIYVRENCYGWNGPWSYRSGWQQISDAVRLCFHTRVVQLTVNSVVEYL